MTKAGDPQELWTTSRAENVRQRRVCCFSLMLISFISPPFSTSLDHHTLSTSFLTCTVTQVHESLHKHPSLSRPWHPSAVRLISLRRIPALPYMRSNTSVINASTIVRSYRAIPGSVSDCGWVLGGSEGDRDYKAILNSEYDAFHDAARHGTLQRILTLDI